MSIDKYKSGFASKRKDFIQVANNVLTVISSILTIGIVVLGIWDWSKDIHVTIEVSRSIQVLPTVTATPTVRPIPTYTSTPRVTATPVLEATPILTPIPEQTHVVKSGEILACISKLYYGSPDAHTELCVYNQSHPRSDLFGKIDCSTIFPGHKVIIPGTLRASIVTDLQSKTVETVILTATVIPAVESPFLCQ